MGLNDVKEPSDVGTRGQPVSADVLKKLASVVTPDGIGTPGKKVPTSVLKRLQTVTAYSPTQPRDDAGKWTSGGGSVSFGGFNPDPSSAQSGIEEGLNLLGGVSTELPELDEMAPEFKRKAVAGIAEKIGPEYNSVIQESLFVRDERSNQDVSLSDAVANSQEGDVFYLANDGTLSGFGPPRGNGKKEIPVADGDFMSLARVDYTARTVNSWAKTSNSSGRSSAIQKAVRREFGLANAAGWSGENVSERDGILKKEGPLLQRIARIQYENTQADLKAAGITSIALHRGFTQWMKPGVRKVENRPLSSWSADRGTTEMFGQTVFSAAVPADRVFSTARTGFGCLAESEFVVLGSGSDEVTVSSPETRVPDGYGGWSIVAPE